MNFNNIKNFLNALFMVSILLSVSGCGGGGGSGGGGTAADVVAPTFSGVAVAISSAASSTPGAAVGGYVTLNWDAATDNVTASNALVYDISVATAASAPFAATYTTAAGATSYTVSGLTNNVDYYFVVRARDAAGNRDANSVESRTHELMGTMNLRGATMFGAAGDIAFTYFDFCNTNTLDFGDGSSVIQNCPVDNSDVTVNHQYAAAGTYTVTLTESPSGATEYITLTVTPVAKVGIAAHQVVISNSATSGGTWSGANPDVFTPNALGAKVAVADIQSRLNAGTAVTITTSTAVGGNGDISVDNAVSWGANALTLSAERDVIVNAVMTASGSSTLSLDHAFFGSVLKVGFNADGTFKGRVDFPLRSGAGILTIGGFPYTLISSLGSAGSTTGADLQGMNGNLTLNYALGSNIDATATSTWNTGAGFMPVGTGPAASYVSYNARFDGLGHTITGLTINRSATSYVGLFGFTNGAKIRNVGLVNGSINGNDYVGGLVGQTWTGSDIISNSYNTSDVSGVSSGNGCVGGLIGFNYGSITRSYNTGIVSGMILVGGLAGKSAGTGGSISDSYNTGAVTGSGAGASIGGLAGENGSAIINSYSVGNVSGTDSIGGLVGYNWYGSITNAYSTGSVTGSINVGGLVGYSAFGAATNSYWDTTTSGQAASIIGSGLTTSQMKAQASFTGWDFASTWKIIEGVSYPTLRTF